MFVPDHTLGRCDAPNFVARIKFDPNFAPSSVMLAQEFGLPNLNLSF